MTIGPATHTSQAKAIIMFYEWLFILRLKKILVYLANGDVGFVKLRNAVRLARLYFGRLSFYSNCLLIPVYHLE